MLENRVRTLTAIRRIARFLLVSTTLGTAGSSLAQTVEILPSELNRIPTQDVGGGTYWQQLAISFDHDDAAGDSTVTLELPPGIVVFDSDGDGVVSDEVRVVYVRSGSEVPGFFLDPSSTSVRLVLGSSQPVAPGGTVYLQFPILAILSPTALDIHYGEIQFSDPRETDLDSGPKLTFLAQENEFDVRFSMDAAALTGVLAAGPDTFTTALGTQFPEEAEVLVMPLPDLVFDGGVGSASNLVGFGDGDDGNDTQYRFFFSAEPRLEQVDETNAIEARTVDGEVYVESEGPGRSVSLLTRDLPAATYYLYVTSQVTGRIPLVRSRPLVVRHEPLILFVDPSQQSITLDSGGLLDLQGSPNGGGVRFHDLDFAAIDHDDSVRVHLFFSADPDLFEGDVQGVVIDETPLAIDGATAIAGAQDLVPGSGPFRWDILSPVIVPAGDYFIYALATGGSGSALGRSEHQVRVKHTPFLRLDPLDDAVLTGADTIDTGGTRPQRFTTLTWGRSGADGDIDFDDDARIDLFYSTVAAAETAEVDSLFSIPGGAAALMADIGINTHQITDGLSEDPDQRSDNRFAWDLWNLADSGTPVPRQGQIYYVYGIISDSTDSRLAQMNGGKLNDAGARIAFRHQPTVRPLQPVSDITVDGGRSGRVSWEDMDLDSDARIRIVLSSEDHGPISSYSAVTSGTAFVANSASGRAQSEVDGAFDLSEDSDIDFFDIRADRFTVSVNGESPLQPGAYYVYLAIEDGDRFDSETTAWRAPGQMEFDGVQAPAGGPRFELLPEVFSMGSGTRQAVEVRIDAAGQAVDLVLINLEIDGSRFSLVDQNATRSGVQPFTAGSQFSSVKLVTNTLAPAEEGSASIFLSFEYFEPTAAAIDFLDGESTVVRFELVALEAEGVGTVDLVADAASGRRSELQLDGQVTFAPEAGPVATATVVAGTGTLRGKVALEGRTDMSSLVEFSLRPWASFDILADSAFAAANDLDPERDGVQAQVAADGTFELRRVPAGRGDLYAHLDGYLDAWYPGLDLSPSQLVANLRPSSTGSPVDTLMLGGDVAGYTETDGESRPDNEVTLADWDFVASLFDKAIAAEEDSARADISGDGLVNIRDLALVGTNFLRRGPRPIYKIADDGGRDDDGRDNDGVRQGDDGRRVWLAAPATSALAGQVVEFTLATETAADITAFQVDLQFDSADWEIVQMRSGPASIPVLEVFREREWGRRVAASLIGGRTGFESGAFGPEGGDGESLLSLQMRALTDESPLPGLSHVILLDSGHRELPTAVGEDGVRSSGRLPATLVLEQNFPNPFNPETTISFVVPPAGSTLPDGREGAAATAETSPVSLEVFNSLGQRVAVLLEGESLAPGVHRIQWNGRDQSGRLMGSGVYFYRLSPATGSSSVSSQLVRRMLLLK